MEEAESVWGDGASESSASHEEGSVWPFLLCVESEMRRVPRLEELFGRDGADEELEEAVLFWAERVSHQVLCQCGKLFEDAESVEASRVGLGKRGSEFPQASEVGFEEGALDVVCDGLGDVEGARGERVLPVGEKEPALEESNGSVEVGNGRLENSQPVVENRLVSAALATTLSNGVQPRLEGGGQGGEEGEESGERGWG